MAKLYFYYSAMNAGKTTTLLQSSYNYQERGMNTLLFTPHFDNRYGAGKVTSRIGLQADAIKYNSVFNFFKHISDLIPITPNLKCILVDEAHFLLKSQVFQLCQVVDQLKLPVLAYGLRTDFLGQTFEGSNCLLAWSDDLIEIKTICHCGKKAIMNARISPDGQMVTAGSQIEIGGNERYISLCRNHYNLAQISPLTHCILD